MCVLMLIFGIFVLVCLINIATVVAYLLPEKKYKPYYPKVSVIVRSWNDGSVVERCIKAFLSQDYPKNRYQIIIADDGSTDKTQKICSRYAKQKKIVYVRFSKHLMRKSDIIDYVLKRYANGEIIVETDVDAVVPVNWVRKMVEPFADKKVGGVTSTVMCGNWYENFMTHIRAIEDFLHFNIGLYGRYKLSGAGILYGGSKSYRKSVWKELGGHPSKTLIEDAELAIAIVKAGYKIVMIKSCHTLQEEVNSLKQYVTERIRWARGDLTLGKIYSKELSENKLHYLLLYTNFSWDAILLLSEVLFFLNPLFIIPILLCLLTLWTSFTALRVKPEFYFYAIPYLIVGPWLQAYVMVLIGKEMCGRKQASWPKVWHYPTKFIAPVD